MTRAARLTRAELRRAIKAADEQGKQLAVRADGTLVFEDKDAVADGTIPAGWPEEPALLRKQAVF